jgi:hypothetical protein
MAWRPFCPSCRRFFNGNAVSDFKAPNGQVGCCPNCSTPLQMKDEDHPPR